MNKLIKQIVESKFNFNIDIKDNERHDSLSKSKYNSISQKQLYIDQYTVDLSLPSGTLWAKCNLGTSKPEEPGNYYAWGEVEPKQDYSKDTYKFGYPPTKYNEEDELTKLLPEDDAAYQFDHRMKMPTIEQFIELKNNTEHKIVRNYNGVTGGLFVGKNGNEMFIPASARYIGSVIQWQDDIQLWSSSQNSNRPDFAFSMKFDLFYIGRDSGYIYFGRCIRPVLNKNYLLNS